VKQPSPLSRLAEDLDELRNRGLLRERPGPPPPGALNFSTNDYLGLAELEHGGVAGAGASRAVSGDHPHHAELEEQVAGWLRVSSALTFSSGYAANVGALGCLAGKGDLIVSDALNHASLIDGARLSGATIAVVPHLDAAAMASALASHPGARRRWVVTESYFSMDADSPDLPRLRGICEEHGAGLYVDEAHAVGVHGPEGRGLCAGAKVVPDVLVGTFGKAFGASGAFVAGADVLTRWLWNRARSFVFSTGMSPVVARAARTAIVHALEHPALRARVSEAADYLRDGLRRQGIHPWGRGHIIPWVVGDPRGAVRVAEGLRERGVIVGAIRPPSVPEGTSRLRIAVTARHTREDLDRALDAFSQVKSWVVSRETPL
jgi:8-amino-7-oxononanoate synthase